MPRRARTNTTSRASFERAFALAAPFTMVSRPRVQFMWDAVQRVDAAGVEGDLSLIHI